MRVMKDAKFIDVDGVRTRYFEGGSGRPLVLVHGGQFGSYYNAYHWSLNFADLCARFHVYAFDKLGQGRTGNPKSDADYTMAAVIDHAYGFLRAAGVRDAVLVGHSRGALPIARIAVDHPETASALVILDSNTLPAEDPATPADFYAKLEENAPPVPDREFVSREPLANSYSKEHITADFVEEMLEVALLPKTIEANKKMARLLDERFLPDVKKKKYETLDLIRAGRLKAPALVVWGLNDPSAPVKLALDLLRFLGAVVPRAELHIFNHAGHYMFRERAPELNRLIANFVDNAGAGKPAP